MVNTCLLYLLMNRRTHGSLKQMLTFKMKAIDMCVIAQTESSCGSNFKLPAAFILSHLPAFVTVNKTKDTL